MIRGHTDIAANALANLVFATFVDFPWQKRIRDRRSGRADKIEYAALDLADHFIRRCKATDTNYGFRGQRLYETVPRFLRPLFAEPRRCSLYGPARRFDIPQIREVRQHRDDLVGFGLKRLAGDLEQIIGAESHGYGTGLADCLLHFLDDLAHESYAILQAAAVFVSTLIHPRQQELVRAKTHAGIDVYDVKAGGSCTLRRIDMPAAKLAYILPVHRSGFCQADPARV